MENRVKPGLRDFVGMFENSEETTWDARIQSERCRNYYDGYQWTPEQVNVLAKRRQAPVTINRIRPNIEWMLGYEIQRRTDPRAFPRSPEDQNAAEVATDGMRYVTDNADWDRKRSIAFEDYLVEGVGAVEVVHAPSRRGGNPQIQINTYRWDRIYWDPHSREKDFADARYLGAVIWKDLDKLRAQYPDKADQLHAVNDSGTSGSRSLTYDDRPKWKQWADADRNRVRVCLVWYLDDDEVWRYAKHTQGCVLEEGESPYRDEYGMSQCPLIMQSCYVDRENNRYGYVKDQLDLQDELNHRRSKALWLLSQRQTWAEEGAFKSIAKAKEEMARPDGHLEIKPGRGADWGRLETQDLAQGQATLMQQAAMELDRVGADNALQGNLGASASGRSVMAQQQGAAVELAPVMDGLRQFSLRVYRQIWNRIQQFWTDEQWIRVTDDERSFRFVAINQRITLQQHLAELDVQQRAQIVRGMGLVPGDPRLNEVVEIRANPAELDVDIIVDEQPATVTLDAEVFENLTNLVAATGLNANPMVAAAIIDMAPNVPREKKDAFLEVIQQAAQSQQEQGQMAAQMEQQKAAIEGQTAEAEIIETMASAEQKAAQADKYRAETAQTLREVSMPFLAG